MTAEIFDGDPEDTEAALMAATYRALCTHGYADLTIERIGEEFGKSTSLLYHHYDGKDELLVAFLGYVLERFESTVPEAGGGPWAELQCVLDEMLAATLGAERREFTAAMVELRAQAAHDPAYREAFTRHDTAMRERLGATVRAGVETGAFRDCDPEAVASLVHAVVVGAMTQRVTTGGAGDDGGVPVAALREELEAALAATLRPGER